MRIVMNDASNNASITQPMNIDDWFVDFEELNRDRFAYS